MMKSNRGKRGQFVIIAVMLSAVMIISIGALMHNAITYYKHEPWEEYATLIGDIEINSRKIVEFSLASYTNGLQDKSILGNNLESWKNDLTDIYPSSGIVLTRYPDAEVIETSLYATGENTYTSIASAGFGLDIKSIGLEGYNFKIVSSLSLKILDFEQADTTATPPTPNKLLLLVKNEYDLAVSGLDMENFQIEGANRDKMNVTSTYDETDTLQYAILYNSDPLAEVVSNPQVEVCDQRGILVVGRYTPIAQGP